nr:hypothetical protein [Tanacetum cinerariifolium]
VNTPRCDEDRLELMKLTVFLLAKVEKVGVEVYVVDLQVFAVRLMLLLLVQKFLLFGLMNWCCSLSAVRSSRVLTAGVATEEDVSVVHDEVPTVDEEPSIPSPTPPTPLTQPSHDIPSTSQVQPTPPQSPQVQP